LIINRVSQIIVKRHIIAHSKGSPLLSLQHSIAESIITTGSASISNTIILIPLLYVKGKLRVEEAISLADPDSFAKTIAKLEEQLVELENKRKLPLTLPKPSSLIGSITTIKTIPADYFKTIEEADKGIIILLGDEVVYEEAKRLNTYLDRLEEYLSSPK
jgi:hypothetical protein